MARPAPQPMCNLRIKRKQLGISQEIVASELHMKQTQYGEIERGVRRLCARNALTLTRLLSLSFEQLLDVQPL